MRSRRRGRRETDRRISFDFLECIGAKVGRSTSNIWELDAEWHAAAWKSTWDRAASPCPSRLRDRAAISTSHVERELLVNGRVRAGDPHVHMSATRKGDK